MSKLFPYIPPHSDNTPPLPLNHNPILTLRQPPQIVTHRIAVGLNSRGARAERRLVAQTRRRGVLGCVVVGVALFGEASVVLGAETDSAGERAEHGFQGPAVEDGAEHGEAGADDGEGAFDEDPVGCRGDVPW
jgi:hypothetical protein